MNLLAETTIFLGQGALTPQSGEGLKDIFLAIIGSFFVIVLGGRVLAAFAENSYGKMLSILLAGIVVAFVCFAPDSAVSVLRGLGQTFFGA